MKNKAKMTLFNGKKAGVFGMTLRHHVTLRTTCVILIVTKCAFLRLQYPYYFGVDDAFII
ncbi:MAG: hypothetical protein IJV69_06440 [Kiritimatiellae bacterium]|nr:hypothetical protein [Kiritimatiellia bacterium]